MPTLQFKGKTAVENHHHAIPHHVLEVDRGLSELGKGEKPSLDGNLIIEGDNLLALKALLPTLAGKVKCIYIDPPYNTGNEGWVYNDNLTQPQFKEWIGKVVGKEGEDACRHDKWCCMMYPRLSLLRELLRADGVILVSIDDIELPRLLMLLAEIFGEENLIECVVWQKSYGGGSKSKHFVHLHEYVVCYAKNKRAIGRLTLPPDPRAKRYYTQRDGKFERRGPFRTQPLWTNSMDERKNLRYPIPYEGEEVWPEKQWQWSEDRALEALRDDELVFVKSDGGVSVYYKQYLRDEEGQERGAKPYSIIEGIYTQQGTNELERIFDGKARFKFPKPSGLIRHLIEVFAQGDSDIVLDSFAGSGTTAHAVLAASAEDKRTRRFVLVQLPFDTFENATEEFNVCKEVTAERTRRVIAGYAHRQSRGRKLTVPGLGGSFTYARVGPPLLGEHRNWGKRMPSFDELAGYIYFTETGRELDPRAMNQETGKIGEHGGASYYLLYTPDPKASVALDQAVLDVLAMDRSPRKVVYCEKVWVHREDLAKLRRELGDVRTMLLPFQVKTS